MTALLIGVILRYWPVIGLRERNKGKSEKVKSKTTNQSVNGKSQIMRFCGRMSVRQEILGCSRQFDKIIDIARAELCFLRV